MRSSELNMWQSNLDIEDYSAHLDRITVFKVPYRWTLLKWTDAHFIDLKHVWAPPLTEVQRYGASNIAVHSKYTMDIMSTLDHQICD